jgi:hypothetical protein
LDVVLYKMQWTRDIYEVDGRATANAIGASVITFCYIITIPLHTFYNLNVQNHRVNATHTSVYQVYPDHDRPRGSADIISVKYLMSTRKASPIMVLYRDNCYIMLDGVHRLTAAQLIGSDICMAVYN